MQQGYNIKLVRVYKWKVFYGIYKFIQHLSVRLLILSTLYYSIFLSGFLISFLPDEYINVVDVEDVEGKSIPFHQTSTPAKTSSLCSSAPAQPTLQSSTHLPARHSHHPAIKYNHLSVYPVSAMLNSQPSRTVSPSSHHHTTVVQPTRSVTPVDRTVIARSSTTPDNKQDHPANDVTPDNKCGSPNSDSGVYSTNQQSSPDSSPAKSSPASSGKSDLDSTITSDPSLLSPRIGAVINEKPKKARTVYSAQQIYGLESLFRANQYPDPDTIERVSQDLDITEAKIKVRYRSIMIIVYILRFLYYFKVILIFVHHILNYM